jgi:hypothetical protein
MRSAEVPTAALLCLMAALFAAAFAPIEALADGRDRQPIDLARSKSSSSSQTPSLESS